MRRGLWPGEGGGGRDLLPKKGGGGAASAGGPFPAGVGRFRPELAEALPRAAMAPGRLAACECKDECVCARVLSCSGVGA